MRSAERTRGTFLCLPKEKHPKEKAPDDLPLAAGEGFPALLGTKRALRNSRSPIAQTVLALIRFLPAVLGCINGTGVPIVGYEVPLPPWCSRASQLFPETSACMSDRPQGGSSRAPETARSAGKSERSGDQAVGCRFLCLLSFGQAKERRAGALSPAHSKKGARHRALSNKCRAKRNK